MFDEGLAPVPGSDASLGPPCWQGGDRAAVYWTLERDGLPALHVGRGGPCLPLLSAFVVRYRGLGYAVLCAGWTHDGLVPALPPHYPTVRAAAGAAAPLLRAAARLLARAAEACPPLPDAADVGGDPGGAPARSEADPGAGAGGSWRDSPPLL